MTHRPFASPAFLLFCALFFFDRATKVATLFFLIDRSYPVLPGILHFSLLIHARNFFLPNQSFFLVGACALLAVFSFLLLHGVRANTRYETLALVLIIEGIASNLFDSIRYGGIIDWIAIPGLTVFNISDAAIIIGCIGLLFSVRRKK